MPAGNILFIATVYTHLANFHLPFMKMLREWGYDVHAVASSAEGRKEEVEELGVTCWEVPFARSPYSPANIHAFRQLRELLKTRRFDLIHVHTPVAAFMGRYLARITGQGPVLYTAHGFHFYKGAPKRNWLVYYNAERIAACWTDGLIVMNEEDFKNARKLGFNPGENLFYVHGVGVDLDKYLALSAEESNVRAELGIEPDDVVITCVAEMIERKNHAFLLEAWQGVARCFEQCHLFLVGTGENLLALQQWAARQQLPRVYFLGFRRDVPQILRETDVATLVSKHEGLPKYIMEAMSAGKPVVASNVRGNRDLVEHEKTGLLVELGDIGGLAAALEKLIADPELRAGMGREGSARIKDYRLEKVLKEMGAIYKRYLS
jgi:glycosyltransferase involved in cell wall biosynthesis